MSTQGSRKTMARTMYRIAMGCLCLLGATLLLAGLLDLPDVIARYFSYGGGLTYNPETIVRFNRIAPVIGALFIIAALVIHQCRGALGRLVLAFNVPDAAWSGHPMLALFLISVAGLFLEVVLVRWISVEVRIFAYFKNLALLACFFGFGLGAGLHRRRVSSLFLLAPLFLLVALVQGDPFIGPLSLRRASVLLAPQSDLIYWGAFAKNAILHVWGLVLISITFLLTVLPFIPIGQLVGRLLAKGDQPIRTYSVNIAGSLVGVFLYAVASFLCLPPAVWFGLPLLIVLYFLRQRREVLLAGAGVVVLMIGLLLFPSQPGHAYWSPYQKLVLSQRQGGRVDGNLEPYYHIDVNNTFYQTIENANQRGVHHAFPYQLVPHPGRVLLVGAGAGNDAAAALAAGAKRVDAVDIDPVVIALGKRLHPEHPYRSDRVSMILNDARAQFKNATGRYDVIVYARLDSHTLLSGFTNIRLDHFVYTRESFEEAKRLLTPDGVLVLSFVMAEPWLRDRLAKTLQAVFGQDPVELNPFTLVVGSQPRIRAALARDPDLARRSSTPRIPPNLRIATDDWPYLYLKEAKIPSLHLWISAFVICLVLLLLRGTGVAVRTMSWHFFFLGAAFLLLEFQGVSRFALLFGTTWFVNTVVISAFLLMILASNWYVQRRQITSLVPYYVGLLASVFLVLLPQQMFLGQSPILRGVIAGIFQAAPVFFAGIIFATSFRQAASLPSAFASNLLGAVFGGLLESASYVTGINGLTWIVMALYGLSWASLPWKKRVEIPVSVEAAQEVEVT